MLVKPKPVEDVPKKDSENDCPGMEVDKQEKSVSSEDEVLVKPKSTKSTEKTAGSDTEGLATSDDEEVEKQKSTKTKVIKKTLTVTKTKKETKEPKSTDDASSTQKSSEMSDLEISLTIEETEQEEDPKEEAKEEYKAEKDPKILRFRRLLRQAGLFSMIKNSDLNAMKSKKARYDSLKKIFLDAGFKDTLSVAACKRFKLKREREKEIAELDVSNIIASNAGQRSTRTSLRERKTVVHDQLSGVNPIVKINKVNKVNMSKLQESDSSADEDTEKTQQAKTADANYLARIKDLIESDESSSDEKKPKKAARVNKPSSGEED